MTEPTLTPMPMCPMAETCTGMMKKPYSGFGLLVPGGLFIGLGILIVIQPRILVWLMAAAFVLLGAMLLMMASFIRKVGTRFQGRQRPMTWRAGSGSGSRCRCPWRRS